MRTVIIKDCAYSEFEKHRDTCLKFKPFGLITAIYSNNLNMALYQFWDTDYIPNSLEKYIVRPK